MKKNMDIKMESFLEEYRNFKQHATEQKISSDVTETLQLFAIYRKDERSNEINKRDRSPATEKQKAYIRNIYRQNGVQYSEENIEILTKGKASDVINSLKGGGQDSPLPAL